MNNTPQQERQLFLDNAFYLLEKADRILSDPSMAFAPVPMNSVGPTIGTYLEWWTTCDRSANINAQGEAYLVCNISGNPLTGSNDCLAVNDRGQTFDFHFPSFLAAYRSFLTANRKAHLLPAPATIYSVSEVLEILHAEDEMAPTRIRRVLHQRQKNMLQRIKTDEPPKLYTD